MTQALIALLMLGMPLAGSVEGGVVHVDPAEATSVLRQVDDLVVLDVRTRREFDTSHLEGATRIDFLSGDFKEKAAKLDRDRAYLVHCRSGRRSTAAVELLKELGIARIYHLDGGIQAWRAAGLPTVAEDDPEVAR